MNETLRWYQPAYWIRGSIRGYQRAISSRTGSNCRYLPTCSAYAIEAVEAHGAGRGTWLAVKRLGRCHPWATDGFAHDPVPARRERSDV